MGQILKAGAKVDEAKASTKGVKSGQVWHFLAGLEHPSTVSFSYIMAHKTIAIPVK